MPNRSDTRSRSPEQNRYPIPPGVLFGLIARPLVQGLQFFWTVSNIKIDKPEDLLERFTHDPTDFMTGTIKDIREGILKPTLRDGELESIYLAFDITRISNADVVASPNAERFVRVKTTPRVSNFMLQWLLKPIQEALLSEQICPLPTSFVDAARGQLAPFDDPASVPPVAKLIEAWRQASDNPTKKIERIKIVDTVAAAMLDLRASPAYQTTYMRQLRAHMASFTLTVGSDKKTYLEWYQALLAEEMDERDALRVEGKDLDKIPSPLIDTFRRVGITASGQYAYTLSFTSLPLQGLLGQKLGPKFIAHAGIAVFKVMVKKELLVYEKGLDGKMKLVGGKPVLKDRILLPWDSNKWFAGIYGDVGAGLSLGVQNESFTEQSGTPVTAPRGTPESKTKRTSDLGEIEFQTNISIDSPKEFEYANFSVAATRAPGVAIGNFVSLDLFNSKYIEFRLQNNIVLSTVQEDTLKLTPPKIPQLGKALEAKKYIEGWTKPKLGIRLFDVSVGWGRLFDLPGVISLTSKYTESEPREKIVRMNGYSTEEAFFKGNSADIDESDSLSSLLGFTPRAVLETFLATERMLFTNGDAQMTVLGYASPEHTAKYNLDLSQRRADAVALAIKDAFGPALQVTEIRSKGLGEEFALRNDPGLLNPPDPIGNWTKKHSDQEAKWPQWRRVDLEIEGIVIARLQDL